ncbi:hypothetical protein GCM10011316_32220 [Roseibium aquae]|uniref:Uncharacterized protein n=1 Tax=Roseibium aquae TaxID=1323746 RepID=A0A916X2Z5_9HYPH|nr:hypothetical protein GCM10011316_32220 [Roseibium aquae]
MNPVLIDGRQLMAESLVEILYDERIAFHVSTPCLYPAAFVKASCRGSPLPVLASEWLASDAFS